MKKTFQLDTDYRGMIDALPDEQAGQLIKAIFAHEAGERAQLEGALDCIRILITTQLDRDREKYETVCEKNRQNIGRRWNKTAPEEPGQQHEPGQPESSPEKEAVPETSFYLKSDKKTEDSKKKNSNASWLMEIFGDFWKVYPKRSNKPDAVRAFIELNPDQARFDRMLEEIETLKMSSEWREANGRHIPLPAKWLRDHRTPDDSGEDAEGHF